ARRLEVAAGPAIIEAGGAAIDPTVFLETLQEGSDPGLCFRIVLGICHQHAAAPHLLRLRARRQRPHGSRAAEERHQRAAIHSIPLPAGGRMGSPGGWHSETPASGVRVVLPPIPAGDKTLR